MPSKQVQAAVLAALAFAGVILGCTGAAAARLHGVTAPEAAPAGDAAPAAAPTDADASAGPAPQPPMLAPQAVPPLADYSALPLQPTATKGFLQCVDGYSEDIVQAISGGCVYGKYVGLGCYGHNGPPIDNLDMAAYWHDQCHTQDGQGCQHYYCNAALANRAQEIIDSESNGCSCEPFDSDCSEKVVTAKAVVHYATLYEDSDTSGCFEPDNNPSNQCGANLEYETDATGGDLYNVVVKDWYACCTACGDDAECFAWSFAPLGDGATDGVCYIKGQTGWTLRPSGDSFSGWWEVADGGDDDSDGGDDDSDGGDYAPSPYAGAK